MDYNNALKSRKWALYIDSTAIPSLRALSASHGVRFFHFYYFFFQGFGHLEFDVQKYSKVPHACINIHAKVWIKLSAYAQLNDTCPLIQHMAINKKNKQTAMDTWL